MQQEKYYQREWVLEMGEGEIIESMKLNRLKIIMLGSGDMPFLGEKSWEVMDIQIQRYCKIVKVIPNILPKGSYCFIYSPKSFTGSTTI